MKRIITVSCVALFALFTLGSCKKCMTCKYNYEFYNSGVWEQAKTVEEVCGRQGQLTEFEDQFRADAEAADVKEKTEVTCYLSE